jgi:hypothetical protein
MGPPESTFDFYVFSKKRYYQAVRAKIVIPLKLREEKA